jgi:nucleoside-diphosphate-sugar epimerase
MRIALTGATGFLGRYTARELAGRGHALQCWYRDRARAAGLDLDPPIRWIPGTLGDPAATAALVEGCDAVVHAALERPGSGFIGDEGDLLPFVERNVLGSLRLIEEAHRRGVARFVFVSTCAVHDVILPDRPLDETHPLWMRSHYGAHKAAIEAFVHSYGLGQGFPICAVRPTGIYGLAEPAEASKWFGLIDAVARGEAVTPRRGGKEVHAGDVARAIALLLEAPAEAITGQAFNCYDRYISEHEVATIARELAGSSSTIAGEPTRPANEIATDRIRALGMSFGGLPLLRQTIASIVEARGRG